MLFSNFRDQRQVFLSAVFLSAVISPNFVLNIILCTILYDNGRYYLSSSPQMAVLLQAALRGHHAREKMLNNNLHELVSTDEDGGMTIVETVQSALRAHRTRLVATQAFQQHWP